ncbi:MAG TPA: peptidylprolyl isomerase [Bryobacteraceae bacterium]
MKFFVIPALSAALLSGQPPQPPKIAPGTPAQIVPAPPPAPAAPAIAPDSIVLESAGKKYTAAEVDKLIEALPTQYRQAAKTDPKVMSQVFWITRLVEEAEKAGLDKKSPYKEQLEYNRMQLLAQAHLYVYGNNINVTPEDQEQYYKANSGKFKQSKVRVIYLTFNPAPDKPGAGEKKLRTEAEAKAKIEDLRKQIVAGADFGKLARENSDDKTSAVKDGEFGIMKPSSTYPEPIKAAVFGLKQGEVSEPVRQPNGFYLIRVDEIIVQPLQEVATEIYQQIKTERLDDYNKKLQLQYQVKVENPAYFSPPTAPQLQQVR